MPKEPKHPAPITGFRAGREQSGFNHAVYEAQERKRKAMEDEKKARAAKAREEQLLLESRNFVGRDLQGSNFHSRNLSRADFTDARLDGVSLKGAVLTDAKFANASAARTDFREANIIGADFAGANLRFAKLNGLPLDETSSMQNVELEGASLEKTTIKLMRFEGVHAPRASFKKADAWFAHFEGGDLEKSEWYSCNGQHIYLTDANMRGAKMDAAFLEEAQMQRTDLEDANLTGCTLRQADLTGANLTKAILENADLEGAVLVNAIIEEANLLGVRGLTVEQLISTIGHETAHLDPDLREALEKALDEIDAKFQQ